MFCVLLELWQADVALPQMALVVGEYARDTALDAFRVGHDLLVAEYVALDALATRIAEHGRGRADLYVKCNISSTIACCVTIGKLTK